MQFLKVLYNHYQNLFLYIQRRQDTSFELDCVNCLCLCVCLTKKNLKDYYLKIWFPLSPLNTPLQICHCEKSVLARSIVWKVQDSTNDNRPLRLNDCWICLSWAVSGLEILDKVISWGRSFCTIAKRNLSVTRMSKHFFR